VYVVQCSAVQCSVCSIVQCSVREEKTLRPKKRLIDLISKREKKWEKLKKVLFAFHPKKFIFLEIRSIMVEMKVKLCKKMIKKS
jgi:hypothetical protein